MKKSIKSILIAAMLGFADATKLAPPLPPETRITEYKITHIPVKEREVYESRPYYSGPIDYLTSEDLAGTGDILKDLRSEIFTPTVDYIAVSNITQELSLKSELFHVFNFQDTSSLKETTNKILFPGQKTFSEVESILSWDTETTETVVTTIAGELSSTPELPRADVQRICAEIEKNTKYLAQEIQDSFAAIKSDLSGQLKNIEENQRAIFETLDRISRRMDAGNIIRQTPKRLAEKAIDDSAIFVAKKAAKALGQILLGAILSG